MYSKTPLDAGDTFQKVPAINESALNKGTRRDSFVLRLRKEEIFISHFVLMLELGYKLELYV